MTSDDQSDFYGSSPIAAWILWTVSNHRACRRTFVRILPADATKGQKGAFLLDLEEESRPSTST